MLDSIEAEYPNLTQYLSGLPNGLDSYPACRTKASLLRTLLDVHEPHFTVDTLPPRLQALVTTPPSPGAWIHEVEYQAALLAVGDLQRLADSEYPRLTFAVAAHLFDSPMYRVLMHVASPNWLLKGTSLRWGLFRQGTKLNTRSGRASGSVRLTFPPGLFNRRCLIGFTGVFHACLAAAGARQGKVWLDQTRGENAIFEATW